MNKPFRSDVGIAVEGGRAQGREGRRRSSTRITLVLIGAASLQACNDPGPAMVQRDLYEHRSKCVQDWGDERKCELITDGQSRGYWYGPGYSGSRSTALGGYSARPGGAPDSGPSKNAVGTHQQVARSGFGSSARSYSSGS